MLRGRIFLTTRAGKWAGTEQRRGEKEENVTFFSGHFGAQRGYSIKLMLSFLDPVCQEPRILWGEFVPDPWHFYFRTQRLRVKSPSILSIPARPVVMDGCPLGTWQFRPYLWGIGLSRFCGGKIYIHIHIHI